MVIVPNKCMLSGVVQPLLFIQPYESPLYVLMISLQSKPLATKGEWLEDELVPYERKV